MGLALDFVWNGTLRENFKFSFSGCFACIGKMFILVGLGRGKGGGGLWTGLSFYEV